MEKMQIKDRTFASRVDVLIANIKVGDTIVFGENKVHTSYEVLSRTVTRGRYGRSVLELKNIETGEVITWRKEEYLTTATCETNSIGYRKKREQKQQVEQNS